jgi:helicase
MEVVSDRTSLLYREWISGSSNTSRGHEVLGSLGVQPRGPTKDSDEWARKEANLAVLRATILYELSQGVTASELERQWEFKGLSGTEERWRDELLCLLSGLAEVLDLRCFYFHLHQECETDANRTKRVKSILLRMRAQSFALREDLTCCSPLGSVLRAIRTTRAGSGGRSVGARSIRRLEEAGIRSLEDLASIDMADLKRLGIRQDLAKQIRAYVSVADVGLP